jgi:hypothetical protein
MTRLLPTVDQDQEDVLESFDGSKSFQPDGEGFNLYFTKEETERYNIDSDAEIREAYVVRDGGVEWFGNVKLNAGFSKEELEEHSNENGWTTTDEYEGSRWSLSYEEPEQGTVISVDKPSIVDGSPLNNVFIKSREVILEPDMRNYDLLKAVAIEHNVDVTVRDSEGLWQKLKQSSTIDAPDVEVLSQLVANADIVTAHLNFEIPSVWISLEQLNLAVQAINEGISAVPEESITAGDIDAVAEERSA